VSDECGENKSSDLTEQCANCGTPIDGDPVHGQGSLKGKSVRRLAGGKAVGASDLFGFDDGPYCSLACAVAIDSDSEKRGDSA